jgi:transposase
MSTLSIAPYFPFARFKVVSQSVHLGEQVQGALLRVEPDLRFRPLCHECGHAGTVHSLGLRRLVRDLNLGQARTLLQVEYRRVWCAHCERAKVEQLPFCDPSCRITHRLARYIYELCRILTVLEVARHLGLDPKTVKAVDQHFLAQDFGQTCYHGLSILALDEISLGHGHGNYMTVVLDYLTGRVVWVGPGHDKDTLDAFFAGMKPEQKQGIQAVALDMWEPYINRVRHHCPQAKIVFDFFHVVKAYGEVIDEVRREEYRRADAAGRPVIKGSRYLLLSNRENLRPEQRGPLRRLLRQNRRLCAVYILKDQLKAIYGYVLRGSAKKALDRWCQMAAEIEHAFMRRFIQRLRFFEYGILNHCEYPIGTSKLEGVNNKIKVLKRKAYGFHDPEYFALKVKQALPGKITTETG